MARASCSRKAALMNPRILSRRFRPDRDERLRRKNALIDQAMERYVEWREECAAVYDAYANWTNAPTEETDLPFAAYSAALDREQSAATVYGRALERLEQSP
jgi:arginyl-tRNA--protein-N-Asp/Glu arginylyltransferase